MIEHRHEWWVAAMAKGEPFASCKHCELVLTPRLIDKRLNDADALLAVVRAAEVWKELGGFYPEVKFWEALAALPEHLRAARIDNPISVVASDGPEQSDR
ncbi:hypothetical protein LCGC14_0572880 [marine sediment metagenome]|uniref:Uncharacterized protein n=1 Tax=marine sediment metagenome TaxID=412755 RepID=A0A0F9S2C0_9ZZZZ